MRRLISAHPQNINANKNISSLFNDFGTVVQSTARVKPGTNKSWALVTFADKYVAELVISALTNASV